MKTAARMIMMMMTMKMIAKYQMKKTNLKIMNLKKIPWPRSKWKMRTRNRSCQTNTKNYQVKSVETSVKS